MASMGGFLNLLCLLCCFMLFMRIASSETDSILQGQQLKDGQELVSAFGTFRLKFFSPSNIRKRYLGIWYNIRSSGEGAVWVANRNTPIFDNSGSLTIDGDGNIKILYSGKVPIVLTSIQASGNTSATLLDSGNFVVRELNSDGSTKQVLWQSFDHPSDTFLPGMKLGINLQTGQEWHLTSWVEDSIPTPGSFTLGMDPNVTNQLIIRRDEDICWTSGVWLNGSFSLPLSFQDHYYFSYVSNKNEKYFTYSENKNFVSYPRLMIDSNGRLQFISFGMLDEIIDCKVGSFRSPPDIGCVDQKLPTCRGSHSEFRAMMGSMSGDGFKFNTTGNLNRDDCRIKCLKNCSCVAYASTNEDGTGCEIWSTKASFNEYASSRFRDIELLESHFFEENKWRSWWLWLIIVIGGAIVTSLLCSLSFLLWRKCKPSLLWSSCSQTWKQYKAKWKPDIEQEILLKELGVDTYHQPSKHGKKSHELQFFSFENIAIATGNFATANKLGEGGFGPVFKGKLLDGQEVAIKRLSKSSGQGLMEFKNEAIVIARLQHTNLVRLVGCCIEKEEKILIYEHMPNKSLDFFLFDPMKKNILDWKIRLNIIEGIIQGLLYLHKYSRLRIIHRDLKASNILLDEEMNPKISDFGMAKIFGADTSKANTNRVVGTYGYMSPEYAMEGIFSIKSDVFSFGVLLLEIVSGRKNTSFRDSDGPLSLISYAWELWREDRGLELIDATLGDAYQNTKVLRCIHVGLLCVQDNPIDRPTMLDVVSMIYNEANQLAMPKQPAFVCERNLQGLDVAECEQENHSLNRVTISEVGAR